MTNSQDKYDKAKQAYMAGKSYDEIGRMFGVTAATVRSWKARKHWADNKSVARVHQTKKLINHDLKNDDAMTDKQKLFCLYYIQSYNATQSYIKAYHCKWSTANVEGTRLLKIPKINKFIRKYKARQTNDLVLELIDLVKDDAKIAFANIGDVVNWKSYDVSLLDEFGKPRLDVHGNQIISHETNVYLNPIDELDPSVIDKVTTGNGMTTVKLKDSDKAKERIYRYFTNIDDDSNGISTLERLLSAITQGARNNSQDN